MRYMIFSGLSSRSGSTSSTRSRNQSANARASSSNPIPSSEYTENDASRIQVYR